MSRFRGQSRFSPEIQSILVGTRNEAMRLGCSYIDLHHILLGMLCAEDNSATQLLRALDVDLDVLKQGFDERYRVGRPIEVQGNMKLTVLAEFVFKEVYREAFALRSRSIDAVHVLLSILHIRWEDAPRFIEELLHIDHRRARRCLASRYSLVLWWLCGIVPRWPRWW